MSLDVYLMRKVEPRACFCSSCGNEHPGSDREEVFEANITHNLGQMAEAAGIYKACWRPEEIGATKAADIIPLLRDGIEKLEANPEHFAQFNASNGWGTYEQFAPWVQKYLDAVLPTLTQN
jgi:hypothetical protein